MSSAHKNTHRSLSRRRALIAGGVGITTLMKSLATGLPPGWLTPSGLAHAQDMNLTLPKTLIMSTSRAGDPVNINCPGAVRGNRSPNPNLDYASHTFGRSRDVRCAAEWGALPNQLRNQLAFVHYEALTAAHPEFIEAMTLHGSVLAAESNSSDMLSSALASMYPAGHCKQVEPIPLSDDPVTFAGQPLQTIKPSRLKQLFSEQEAELSDLRRIRDETLDEIYQGLKVQGSRPQRRFLDRYITSRDQARSIGNQLGDLLNGLSTNEDAIDGAGDQVIAAVALAQLKIAPVINLKIPFGGDNHNDADLSLEAAETRSGIGHIEELWRRLGQANIRDDVNFAMLNVFGRTFDRNSSGGRNHNRYHGVMVTFGPQIQGGVYGGATADGRARNINPNNGRATNSGGIMAANGLIAAGATLALSLGHSEEVIRQRIRDAEFIPAMIKS